MECFGLIDTWREQMECCWPFTHYILSLDKETADYHGYKALLENYTNLSTEITSSATTPILFWNTSFVILKQ
jgi:hypothetical protein